MYYTSSRILENLPSEIYSHLIKKRPKDKIFAIDFIFTEIIYYKDPWHKQKHWSERYMLCVVYTYWISPVPSSYFTGEKSKYSVVVVLLCFVGVGALKFLQDPPQLQASHVGWSVDYNCTTDNPYATVSLLYSRDFGVSYNVLQVSPNKLLLRKQVFTIVNLILSDGGQYKCKATDQSGQTIEWNSGSMLFIQAGL